MQTKLFIGGEFVDAADGGKIDVINPYDGSLICQIEEATGKDVDRAVDAAKAAYPAWRDMDAAERGLLLHRLADLIEARAEEFLEIEVFLFFLYRRFFWSLGAHRFLLWGGSVPPSFRQMGQK